MILKPRDVMFIVKNGNRKDSSITVYMFISPIPSGEH